MFRIDNFHYKLFFSQFIMIKWVLKYRFSFRRFLVHFWSRTFGLCNTCLSVCLKRSGDQLGVHKAGKPKFKDLNEDLMMEFQPCQSCRTLDKGKTISVVKEMELCRQFVIESGNVCRQRNLGWSHLQWLHYFCENMLKRMSK